MTNDIRTKIDVEQLLHDADCPDEFIQQFLRAMETTSVKNQLYLLRSQRCRQLERLHEEEKKLDCLDFLRYELEKQLPSATPYRQKRTAL